MAGRVGTLISTQPAHALRTMPRALTAVGAAMLAAYLLLNAVLYAVFAAASTIVPARISASLGFTLDTQGRIEFLTVYGGLELGLAAFYAWAVYAGVPAQRVALMFSLFVYAALVLYRGAGFALYGAPGTTLMGVAGLELLMLIGAVTLVLRSS